MSAISPKFYDAPGGSLPIRPEPHPELPRISVITPNFNYGHFLERCIRSVLGQDYPNIEYHIIDGGSTDTSVEVIKRFQESGISSWTSEPDNGQTDAINKGFAKCTGHIFMWLNSDDAFSHPGVLSEVAQHFTSGVQFLVGRIDRYRIDAGGKATFLRTDGSVPVSFEQYLHYWKYPCLPQPAVFVARDIAAKAFPLSTDLRLIMDYQFFLRCLACKPRAQWVDRTFVDFYMHDTNLSCSANSPPYEKWDLEFKKVFEHEANGLPQLARKKYLGCLKRHRILNNLMRQNPGLGLCLNHAVRCPGLLVSLLYWKIFIKSILGSGLYESILNKVGKRKNAVD